MDAVLRTEHSPFLGVYDAAAYALPRTTARRAAARVAEERGEEELKKGIAELYDESSEMWEMLWGDHMHHGFYDKDALVSLSDHGLAQLRMVEEALAFAGIREPNGGPPFDLVWPNGGPQGRTESTDAPSAPFGRTKALRAERRAPAPLPHRSAKQGRTEAFFRPCLAEQRSSFGLAYQAEQNGLCSAKHDQIEALCSALFGRMVPEGEPALGERALADTGE